MTASSDTMQAAMSGRRVLVRLEPGAAPAGALTAAARLANWLDATLVGVFVRDADLLALSDLPFAHEVALVGGRARRLSREDVIRSLRVEAERARRRLQATAESQGLTWSFESLEGRADDVVGLARTTTDIVTVEAAPVQAGRASMQVTTTRRRSSLLLVERGRSVPRPHRMSAGTVVYVDSDGEGDDGCLAAAQQVAARIGAELVRLPARGRSPGDLGDEIRAYGAALVVGDAAGPMAEAEDQIAELACSAGCPVLLLAGDGDETLDAGHGADMG